MSFANIPGGTIYYTLDGSDPRVPAGGDGGGTTTVLLDEGAPARALVPLTDPGTGWRALGYNDSSWLSGTVVSVSGVKRVLFSTIACAPVSTR